AGVSPGRRAAWDRALAGVSTRLSEPARVFAQLAQEDTQDAAAWYNLAVARAWLGDHPGALEALDPYLGVEADDGRAEAAAALGEVLRLGDGMEEAADYQEYSATYQVRNAEVVFGLLQAWDQEGRLAGVQTNQEQGMLSGLVMEEVGGVLT